MTYTPPQALVYQDFNTTPAAADTVRSAHMTGPNAKLIRYDQSTEKALGYLGYYDWSTDNAYLWPERPAGAVVDTGYTNIVIENALLNYFSDLVGAGSTITKLSGYNNRISSATKYFATNANYARHSSFLDRDVQPGDVVRVRGLNAGNTLVTLWTTVKSVIADSAVASLGSASTDSSNPSTTVASATVTQTAGANNNVEATANGTSYNGLISGYISETYDAIVVTGSTNGDHTTAVLRIVSGSGTDNVASLVPSAAGSPTAIGTRGLLGTFSVVPGTDSLSADAAGVPHNDLIAGQRFHFSVTGAFTKPVPTASGTYSASFNADYVVTVTRGGLYASATKPQITVTTTTGVDVSGPTTVSAAATAVAVGTKGALMAFSGLGLRKGDVYYVSGTGTADGPMRILELSHNMDVGIVGGTEVSVDLYILKPKLSVDQDRVGYAPITNWSTSATEVTVASGIIAYDDTWTDAGVQQPLTVYSESSKLYGKLYVEARYWLNDLVGTLQFFTPDTIDSIPGPLDPDNPLKYAASFAMAESGGVPVGLTAVSDPTSLDAWAAALEATIGDKRVRDMVPLSRDKDVLDLFAAHVNSLSSPTYAQWRAAWFNLSGVPEIPLVSAGSTVPNHLEATTSDGAVCLAVISDDAGTSGTQYTLVRCTSGNSNFLTNKVKGGDILRANYTADGFGGYVYSSYVIDSVVSEDQLLLVAGPASPVTTAAKIEVWRNLNAEAEADEIVLSAGSWGNRRIKAVWPDKIEVGSRQVEGYFACAAFAGARSGILPQRSLTRYPIGGFSSVNRTTRKFTTPQLNKLAGGGVFIITQNPNSGQIYCRHAVTTGNTDDVNQREEAVTAIIDYMSYGANDLFDVYTGQLNLNDANILLMNAQFKIWLDGKMTESLNTDSGPPITAYDLLTFGRHPTLVDRLLVRCSVKPTYAMNNEEIHFIVG